MTISELIEKLEKIKAVHGDLEVKIECASEYEECGSEYYDPDPIIQKVNLSDVVIL